MSAILLMLMKFLPQAMSVYDELSGAWNTNHPDEPFPPTSELIGIYKATSLDTKDTTGALLAKWRAKVAAGE